MIGRRHVRLIGLTVAALLLLAACAGPARPDQPSQIGTASSEGICARTSEVRAALLAALDDVQHCSEVSDEQLASIDGTLDLSGRGIEAITAGDLAGLDRLQTIDLSGNRIRQLPDRLFSGLPDLCQVDLRDNPGAPFAYRLRLIGTHADDLPHLLVESELAPAFDLNVLLGNDHVALSVAVARISAGEGRSSPVQLGGVFGAEQGRVWIVDAAFAPRGACARALRHPGIELSFERTELVVAGAQTAPTTGAGPAGNAVCAGIPTQVIVVGAHSFASEERIERLVTSRSGACDTSVSIEPEPGRAAGGDCTLTEYVEATSGGTSQTSETQGDCGWLRVEHAAGQGGTAGVEGCAAQPLRLRVDAETFNRTGRVDLVRYDPDTRCYTFISAARDPDRDAPFRFSPDQACAIATGEPLSGDCGSILIWGGSGRGGVNSEAEARAEVARIRPGLEGEADLNRASVIEACQQLPPLSIGLDADARNARRPLHAYSADADDRCFMALVLTPDPGSQPPRVVADERRCVISAAFQLLGFPYLLPTSRSGDCGGWIHFAWYMPAGGQISEAEFVGFVEQTARDVAVSGVEGWLGSQAAVLCVNDVCVLDWSGAEHDPEP